MTDELMAMVVRVHETGGPDKLVVEEIKLAAPGPGEALVRHQAIGLNFIDTYVRAGFYPAELPVVLGEEAAGVVEAVGAGVTSVRPGDRVGYVLARGAYASARVLSADALIVLPDSLTTDDAAAVLLKGLTCDMLLRRVVRVEPGWTILVHAAAGGVGLLLTQWATALGCSVIGTAGSPDKAERARAAGCVDVILYGEEDVAARVRDITNGDGVRVAYDGVGQSTQKGSLDSLAARGWYVTYGNASGPAAPVDPLDLLLRGSLFMTRPSLAHYVVDKSERDDAAKVVFDALAAGHMRAHIGQTFALTDAADAHRALESRATICATLLRP